MSDRHSVSTGSPYEPIIGISRAVRIGHVIAVAGTAPLGPDGRTVCVDDAAGQARRCFEISRLGDRAAGRSPGRRHPHPDHVDPHRRLESRRASAWRVFRLHPPGEHHRSGRRVHRSAMAGRNRSRRGGLIRRRQAITALELQVERGAEVVDERRQPGEVGFQRLAAGAGRASTSSSIARRATKFLRLRSSANSKSAGKPRGMRVSVSLSSRSKRRRNCPRAPPLSSCRDCRR